jgi:hypothetical protein
MALVVGVVAFLLGWVVVLGGVLAIAGIILGVVAIRSRRARVRSIIGLCLSGLALLCNVVVSVILAVTLTTPGAFEGLVRMVESNDPNPSNVQTTTLTTPCYAFDAPAGYINNQSTDATAACETAAELWGEYNPDGTVNNTGVGAILGGLQIEPISTDQSAGMTPDGSLDGLLAYLDTEYIPQLGTPIGEAESLTIDGTPASLIRVTSDVAETKTKALLVLQAPAAYSVGGEEARFFLLSFVIPEDNGDAIIDAAVSSWTWQ